MDILDLVEKKKIKRLFLTRNKLSYPGAVSHITQRATGKEPLFLEEADYLYMLHLLKENAKEFNLDVFCFTLMPNHIHLLIRLNKDNLSQAMKRLFESYAKYFNKKYGRKGHVFCGSYRYALCFDESYLLAASVYIHLNPQRAGLVKSFSEYRWSSVAPYIRHISKETFLNYQFVLKILCEDLDRARKDYRRLLDEMSQIDKKDVLEDRRALERFREKLIRSFGKKFFKGEKSPIQGDLISDTELEEKIESFRKYKRLTTPHQAEARKFLIEQLRARGFTISEIAERLSLTRQTIHKALKL